MPIRFQPTYIIAIYKPLAAWAQVPNIPPAAAKTPVGLPIPSSAYNKALAKLLLKRMLPLPAQIILELGEHLLWNKPSHFVPPGWSLQCTGTQTGPISGWQEQGSFPLPNQCNNVHTPLNNRLPNPRQLLIVAQQIGTPFHRCQWHYSAAVANGLRPLLQWPLVIGLPEKIPPEWLRPDLAPELVPPTAPQLDPLPKKYSDLPNHDHKPAPWEDEHYGPERGPAPDRDISPVRDRPAPGYDPAEWLPSPGWDPWADPIPTTIPRPNPANWPFPVSWPTLPRSFVNPRSHRLPQRNPSPVPNPAQQPPAPVPIPLPFPPLATVPLVHKGPNVQVRVEPPGWTPLRSLPPRAREKERKFIAAVPPGSASRIIGGVTEGLDIVKCMHDALPKHLKAKPRKRVKNPHPKGTDSWADFHEKNNKYTRPTFLQRANAVYQAYGKQVDQIEGGLEHGLATPNYVMSANDIFGAIVECGKEQLKDRIYAALGRAGGKAGRRLGLSHGFGLGGSVRQEVTGGLSPVRT